MLAQVDIAVASEVIEHLSHPGHLLQQMHDVLADDGIAVLTTPNLAALTYRLMLLRGRSPNPDLRGLYYEEDQSRWRPHLRVYTVGEMHELLHAYGFAVMDTYYVDVRPSWKRSWIRDMVFSLVPSFRHEQIVIARKISPASQAV